ncbi:MAG: type VI secretion system lipoprotein TssJ [Pseudomonadota bacterium]
MRPPIPALAPLVGLASALFASSALAVFGLFEKDASVVRLAVTAQADLNPLPGGAPAPVAVRIYQLRNDLPFQAAEFWSLYERSADTLGGDLVAEQELLVQPDSTNFVGPLEMAPGVTHLALFIGFREWQTGTWRVVVPTPRESKLTLHVHLKGNAVEVEPRKRRWWRKRKRESEQGAQVDE